MNPLNDPENADNKNETTAITVSTDTLFVIFSLFFLTIEPNPFHLIINAFFILSIVFLNVIRGTFFCQVLYSLKQMLFSPAHH